MTKDYFTALEAADYACVPLADFEAQADTCGVLSFQYMGQRVYRKADLQASMERAWRLSSGWAVALPSSPGFKARKGRSRVWEPLPLPKPKSMGRAPGATDWELIGTRKPSARGRESACLFAEFLVRHGATVVSGLAMGIDTVAHRTAIACRGRVYVANVPN